MNINDIDLLDADRFVRMEHHDMFTTCLLYTSDAADE